MPKVSIIIANYNGKKIITECLRALEKQSFKNFELIIIDNGSSDNSLSEMRQFLKASTLAPLTRLIESDVNLGFTGGNIEGLKYADGDYIALLNNDTKADPDWLKELVSAMHELPDAGICASKMIVYGTNIIDSAGDGYSTFLKGLKRGEGESSDLYTKKDLVFGACAGAALYRRKMIDEIGFLDNDFFLIHEDTDINFRAQLAGWKVLYIPTAVVFHRVSSTIGHMSDTAVYYSLRNSELVRIKNVPPGILLRYFPEFILGSIAEFIFFVMKHGKFNIYFKAKVDVLRQFPLMLKKRRKIMKNKKVTNSYLKSIITPTWQFLKSKIGKLCNG